MKMHWESLSIRMIWCCLILVPYDLLIPRSSYADERTNTLNQLEPVITRGATVRGLTKPFEANVDGKKTYFQNGLQFVGQVIWLDESSLDLKAPDSPLQVNIPLDAVIKLEMKIEKKNWPIASCTLIGLAFGV